MESYFLSHKCEDMAAAKEIASYIMDGGIDVYLDDNDSDLKSAVKENNSKKRRMYRKGICGEYAYFGVGSRKHLNRVRKLISLYKQYKLYKQYELSTLFA